MGHFGNEIENIKHHMKLFNKVTELNCILINDMGETVALEGDSVDFCSKFINLTGNDSTCEQSHLYASKQSEELGSPYIFFCPGGLVMMTMAIILKGTFRGALLAGPMHMNTPDTFTIKNLIKSKNIEGKEILSIETAYKLVPVIHPSRAKYLLELLGIFVKDVLGEEHIKLKKKQEMHYEQRVISGYIHEIKEQGQKFYPIDLEKSLTLKIKRGDSKSAKAVLNELLGYILFKYKGNDDRMKSMIIELLVVMSRAALDGGAKYEMILESNSKFYSEAFKSDSIEELCVLLTENLETLTSLIFNFTRKNHDTAGIIKKAIEYINDNFSREISLEEVANYVNLSPSYFSRFFYKETEMKYSDYLNTVRTEESKKLLSDFNLSITEIAHMVGFNDQSYYTKVFKKYNGVSPGKFKKL